MYMPIKEHQHKEDRISCWPCTIIIVTNFHFQHRVKNAKGNSQATDNAEGWLTRNTSCDVVVHIEVVGLQEVQSHYPEQVFNWLQWECMILAGAKENVHCQSAWSDVNTSYYRI